MRKSDKKIENQLRKALTEVCESALKRIHGFQWLTHIVDYTNVTQSLKVLCIFDTEENLESFRKSEHLEYLTAHIKEALRSINIELKHAKNTILYDTEESCAIQHNGNWARRLAFN